MKLVIQILGLRPLASPYLHGFRRILHALQSYEEDWFVFLTLKSIAIKSMNILIGKNCFHIFEGNLILFIEDSGYGINIREGKVGIQVVEGGR